MVQPIRPQDASGIYRRHLSDAAPAGGPASGVDGDRSAEGVTRGRRSDSVSLSANAQSIRRVFDAINGGSDVRTDLVERLQAQIANGSYEIDADSIARRLLEDGLSA
ncbi:MAG: flagellar biosynthesis anti-sigma factor FlgM [Dehalococcoidia bacterium]